MPDIVISHLDYSHMDGGLVRMMNRFKEEGTLIGTVEEDDYLREDGNAALLGLLYDQRVRAEYAFTGPHRLRERLGHLDMQKIAEHDPDSFKEIFAQQPAVHRFTNKMADQTQAVAGIIADDYDGQASNLWNGDAPLKEVEKRVRKLPGFGKLKTHKVRYVLHYWGHRDFSDEAGEASAQ